MSAYYASDNYCQCRSPHDATGGCMNCQKMVFTVFCSDTTLTESKSNVWKKRERYTAPLKSRDKGWER